MISSGLKEMLDSSSVAISCLDLPSVDLTDKRKEEIQIDDEDTGTHQEKLDRILSKINSELVGYRKGCWEAFDKRGEDYIGQSSSSMRRLVDSVLRIVAPKEEVEKTRYFQDNKEAKTDKGLPTRKARIYCALSYDDKNKKSERIMKLTKGFLEAYDNLTAWDHVPIKEYDFVHGVFIVIEGCLLSLLSEWDDK